MENKLEYAITEEETRIADRSVVLAVEAGASAVQVTLDKARTEIYAWTGNSTTSARPATGH